MYWNRAHHRLGFLKVLLLLLLAAPSTLRTQTESSNHEQQWAISIGNFSPLPHFPPMNQDSTLVCWSFATTSFIESEMLRVGRDSVRLSVLFFVYYRLLEKAEAILDSKGKVRFSPGDLFSGVLDVVRRVGVVPAVAYEGEKQRSSKYNHTRLYKELDSLLVAILRNNSLSNESARERIQMLLNTHLGIPPRQFTYKGKHYTPTTFRDSVVALNFDDYVTVTSFLYAPYFTFTTLDVPDNWKNDSSFYNLPLETYLSALREALANGFTVVIDADITEKSYNETKQWCVVPNVDVNNVRDLVTERERMFKTGETTDDHLMHVVGYVQYDGSDWYLAKDSWTTAWEGSGQGYMMIHSSYVALKILAYMVHRDGVPSLKEFLQYSIQNRNHGK